MVLALRFLAESWDHGATLYMQDPSEPFWSSYDWFYRLFVCTTEIAEKQVSALVRYAIIPILDDCTVINPQGGVGRNRFHLIAHGTLPLVSGGSASQEPDADGAPYHFNQLLVDIQGFLITNAKNNQKTPLNNMLQRVSVAHHRLDLVGHDRRAPEESQHHLRARSRRPASVSNGAGRSCAVQSVVPTAPEAIEGRPDPRDGRQNAADPERHRVELGRLVRH
jgi:hypothetical protein